MNAWNMLSVFEMFVDCFFKVYVKCLGLFMVM
jgi:hypothetical protein